MSRILIMFALLIALLAPARAQAVPESDAREFERIITEQLEAFKIDDGSKAYGFAAPNIQLIFPSVDSFMAMVKQGYPQVYRPQSYKFLKAEPDATGRPSQKVLIVGPDGKAYTALYTMERQPDGSWKIAGCVILREAGLDA